MEKVDSEKVTLISQDGQAFVIDKETVKLSKVLEMFLDPELGWKESQTNTIHLKGINSRILDRVCTYLQYKKHFEGSNYCPPFDIAAEESLDLLLVADYLEV